MVNIENGMELLTTSYVEAVHHSFITYKYKSIWIQGIVKCSQL